MHETLEKRQEQLTPPRVSFRDPSGSVVRLEGRIYRVVGPDAASTLKAFLETKTALRWRNTARFIGTIPVEDSRIRTVVASAVCAEREWDQYDPYVVEHSAVPFPSYPWEWAPCMLGAAATLTLQFAEEILDEGYGLKDATPLNVLFHGPHPVFIDVLSVEPRDCRSAHWFAHGQFVRTFLLPLALSSRLGMPLDKLLYNNWDGLDIEQVFQWLSVWQRFSRPFLTAVTIPVWLSKRAEALGESLYRPNLVSDPLQAVFVLRRLIQRSLRSVSALQQSATMASRWSGYSANLRHYSDEGVAAKEAFVRQAVQELNPTSVLDIGCNNGHFSRIAAEGGAEVISIDSDPEVIAATWRSAIAAGANILPLVVNIARPTAQAGWRGEECDSFLDRARGRFDLLLMLAVVHHLIITERIPLSRVVDLTAELTRSAAVVEFVDFSDPMFKKLVRGREELYCYFSRESFEKALTARFDITRSEDVTSTRRLYLIRKRR